MRGWFERKAQKSLVFMCVKELKWHLQQQPVTENSKLLVMANLVRIEITKELPRFELMVHNPFSFSEKELIKVYREIEIARNKKSALLNQEKQRFQIELRQHSIKFPDFLEQVSRNRIRGMEVWMCTLGLGIAPDYRNDIGEIWTHLRTARGSVDSAVDELYKIEKQINEMTGNNEPSFFQNNHDYWKKVCEFSPLAV